MNDGQTEAVLAVARALSAEEEDILLSASHYLYPKLQGAQVADILDILEQHDSHLFWTEPLYEGSKEVIEAQSISPEVWNYAVQACILKGPTPGEVIRVALKAQSIIATNRRAYTERAEDGEPAFEGSSSHGETSHS